jgi:hypothetical protein
MLRSVTMLPNAHRSGSLREVGVSTSHLYSAGAWAGEGLSSEQVSSSQGIRFVVESKRTHIVLREGKWRGRVS